MYVGPQSREKDTPGRVDEEHIKPHDEQGGLVVERRPNLTNIMATQTGTSSRGKRNHKVWVPPEGSNCLCALHPTYRGIYGSMCTRNRGEKTIFSQGRVEAFGKIAGALRERMGGES